MAVPAFVWPAGAAAVALTTTVVVLWPGDVTALAPRIPKAPPVVIRPLPDIAAALDTPAFSATRTPAAPTEVPAQPVAPPSPPPQLVGTIAGAAGNGVALMKLASGDTVTLRVGEEADTWRLTMVGDGRATIAQGDRIETLALDYSNKQSAGGSPPATDSSPPGNTPQ